MSDFIQDIIKQLNQVQFDEEESSIIEVNAEEIREGVHDCSNSCNGKFINLQEINLRGLRNALSRVWRFNDIRVFRLSTNLYKFFFSLRRTLSRFSTEGLGTLRITC